ncbi:protein lethal(2)essential for life [Anabrus simplex]|uniref:protein lethal(2)essential for life n=1 Tax=Anabrus simplex TaxID=316456 RepID=UPI0035A2C074
MSLAPYLMNDFFDDWDVFRPRSLFDPNFGLGLLNEDMPLLQRCPYFRPWRHRTARDSGVSNLQYDKDAFRVNLDVRQFKPEEIVVKTVGNSVLVEGKHEERPDEHGFVSRQFQRRYILPKDVDPNTVASKLSSDGILTIEAPRKALSQPKGERVIPITQTGGQEPMVQ